MESLPLAEAKATPYGKTKVAVLLAAVLASAGGCGDSPEASSASQSLPSPGPDAHFAGDYAGTASYVASLMPSQVLGSGDAGTPPPDSATGVLTTSMRIDDGTTDSSLGADGLRVMADAAAPGTCILPGTVTARRYDPSGGYVQLPLTVASAALTTGSVCTWPVDGGDASFSVASSDVKLYADGSLELAIAGPIAVWPSSSPTTGTLELTFFGQRPPPNP